MSYHTRSLSSHMRAPSASTSSTGQSPALLARIEEKKAELESLRELRDLSAAVAGQMEALETKLSTLSDGTEAIAVVMGNWHNVLRAINMASSKLAKPNSDAPADDAQDATGPLPQTLVRIPTEHAPALQAQAEAAEAAAEEEESRLG
ncbi:DASH complex subunit Dad2-domain-containing protein [Ilyonectria robusta]|uniref:DASH complex subunit Dad2-domain-containing protein n=1 Tax=Ilyonectria robusta TaxID=1079257 RepID=UPI001E8CF89B|nr:DASH complex subunit Dad2-domain-containing protein [Ilyonectria robusta]KAH8714225.1 DASH complex subunit Dad2-domain-containing protein [Ilyonectria robusta]